MWPESGCVRPAQTVLADRTLGQGLGGSLDGAFASREAFVSPEPRRVQVFGATGRLCGVIEKPQADKPFTSCVFAGPKRDILYATNGDTIFARRMQARGAPIAGQK